MLVALVLSGLALWKPVQFQGLAALMGGYEGARLVHFWMTIGLSLFFIIHVLQVMRAGWGNFRSMVTGYVVERRSPPPAVDDPTISPTSIPQTEPHDAQIGGSA